MYTVNFYELTLANIIALSPYLITDISEQDYGFEAREQMGLVFEEPSDAIEKAREIFWNNRYESKAAYWSEECKCQNAYDSSLRTIRQATDSIKPSQKRKHYFSNVTDAEKALKEIGVKNFARYVLKLHGQPLYEQVEY